MADPVLHFDSVSYTYRGEWLQRVQALKSVSFSVPRASAYGFLGANGAGKSTSIKLLMGLLRGHQGQVQLFGQDIGQPALRRQLGYLPEHPFFYENLKVHEYLRYLGRLSGLDASAIKQGEDYVYERLDLGDLRQRKLGSFSKGMRQRFGLAQAVFHRPQLLVLDEPFSGLDPIWRTRFREVLIDERDRGVTIFFSSHILSDIEDLCTHFAVIDHGKVLEQGEMHALLGGAPLHLLGRGPKPDAAVETEDGCWRWDLSESERAAAVAEVMRLGGEILRLERERQALQDHFVARVRDSHAAANGADQGGGS